MAKEQKRGNREIRKPKSAKPVAAVSVAAFLNKKETASEKPARKKG
ncbi:hypothetical protein [Azospirillum doebereinerae]|nr:hypothetical protein [Azospirillum doebereinerae]MCG5238821.1 hypothetical protein [Azospirillum doebereinerae]